MRAVSVASHFLAGHPFVLRRASGAGPVTDGCLLWGVCGSWGCVSIVTPATPGLQKRSAAVTTFCPDGDSVTSTGADVLAAWVERTGCRARKPECAGLRFAFYGRVSTEDWQDPVTSRARQYAQAAALVAGRGRIAVEFFDSGESRTLPWPRRPQAAALADPDRGWDAIVIGEYERAFYGNQYGSMAPLLGHYGIQLWMPEAGGPVGGSEDDEQLMLALGLQSKREITRTRIRVRAAMAVQTRAQGR